MVFDEIIDRKGTDSVKYEALKSLPFPDETLSLWVADMDFRTPDCILNAIRERCDHGILGYTGISEQWYKSIIDWLRNQHNWTVRTSQINYLPGVVPGISYALQSFTKPGDKVLIQQPVYYPFMETIEKNGCQLVVNKLIIKNENIDIDFNDFEQKIKGCKMFLLCNPHNPGGRIWKKEELSAIAEICHKNNVLVISDEIHADMPLFNNRHLPFATVSEKAKEIAITLMSPSKAFNCPALATAYCIIENKNLFHQYRQTLEKEEVTYGNIFAHIATIAAYTQGESWLNEMLNYVEENILFIEESLKETPIRPIKPQASFLVFLNCRELNMSQPDLVRFFTEKAKLLLNDGCTFGAGGEGFMRINAAAPRSMIEEAMKRIICACKNEL